MQTDKTLETSDRKELDAVRFYDLLDCLLQDLDTNRILHILPTRGSLSFQHRSTRYNVTDKDYVILPNAALSRDFASSTDFEALMFSLSPDCANQFVLRSNYGIIGHLALLQNPVMRLTEAELKTCRHDIERIRTRMRETEHLFLGELIEHLMAAHILDLYDIHARGRLTADFPDRAAELLRRFTDLLSSGSYREHRELDWYAQRLFVTPHYLSEICRKASGRSASYFIDLFTVHRPRAAAGAKRRSSAENRRRFRVLLGLLFHALCQAPTGYDAFGLPNCQKTSVRSGLDSHRLDAFLFAQIAPVLLVAHIVPVLEVLKGDNKELLIVPGASHTDLYDKKAPFDKIETFYRNHLK